MIIADDMLLSIFNAVLLHIWQIPQLLRRFYGQPVTLSIVKVRAFYTFRAVNNWLLTVVIPVSKLNK